MNTNIDWDAVGRAYASFIRCWQDITAPSPKDFFNEGFLYGLNQAKNQEPAWISVMVELPPANELVLCVGAKGGRFLGENPWVNPSINVAVSGCYMSVPNARGGRYVTHWMRLPKSPNNSIEETNDQTM